MAYGTDYWLSAVDRYLAELPGLKARYAARADQRIIELDVRLARAARPLIPRGNQPLDALSPVPVVVDGIHAAARQPGE